MKKHRQKKLEFLFWGTDPVGTVRGVFAPHYSEQLLSQLAALRDLQTPENLSNWDRSPLGVLYRKLDEAFK